jgi:hypothetical protein
MELSDLDSRQLALILSRARCVIGLSLIAAPSVFSRTWFGTNDPATNAALRFAGIRDLALGVGALTNLKQRGQDAEWVSMGALSDGVDGLVSMLQPGLPKRARLFGVGALGMGALLLKISRDLAAERQT